jgi:hypothetical protein
MSSKYTEALHGWNIYVKPCSKQKERTIFKSSEVALCKGMGKNCAKHKSEEQGLNLSSS